MAPSQGAIWHRRLLSVWWCLLITLLILVVAGLVVVAVARRERSVTTWYACIQSGQVFIPMHYEATNRLTDPVFDPYSKQPSYKACAVNIRRLAAWESQQSAPR